MGYRAQTGPGGEALELGDEGRKYIKHIYIYICIYIYVLSMYMCIYIYIYIAVKYG